MKSRSPGSSISEADKVKLKGHALSFLESQLEKMPILKPPSLKRLTEETWGTQRELCQKPDVSVLPMTPLLSTRGHQEAVEESWSLSGQVEIQRSPFSHVDLKN